jgi:hypothetical protein
MADDKTTYAADDPNLVSLENDVEIDYWTKKFGLRSEHVARAVARVGRSAVEVEKYLKAIWPY